MKSYGITEKNIITDKIDLHQESLAIRGYSIEADMLSRSECEVYCKLLEEVYEIQETAIGKDVLQSINESYIARMPFVENRKFNDLFMHPLIIELAERMLGKNFQLHLQNGIMNKPNLEHHQASWHRDLPYQDWVISKPLGFNAFYCLTDFTIDNGATTILPYSHKLDYFPSIQFVESNQIQITAKAGSVLFFDSMIYHRASYNASELTRYGINNMFVVPILKQQIDIPAAVNYELNELEKQILGFNYRLAGNVNDYRNLRIQKLAK